MDVDQTNEHENLCFSLRFNMLNDFSQLIEIFSNIDPNSSNNGVKFDVVNNADFQGIMVSSQRSETSIIGVGSVECIVEYLDASKDSNTCFLVNIAKLKIMIRNLPTDNLFYIKKFANSNKIGLESRSPNPDDNTKQTGMMSEMENINGEDNDHTNFFGKMRFPFHILVDGQAMREYLRKLKDLNNNIVIFTIEGVASSTDCSIFRMLGEDNEKDCALGFERSLYKGDDEGDIVYCTREGSVPKGSHVLQSVQYNTHQILDIIKNMKPSKLRVAFGKYQYYNDELEAMCDSEEGQDPLFIELKLGGTSSWVRFLVASRVDGEY